MEAGGGRRIVSSQQQSAPLSLSLSLRKNNTDEKQKLYLFFLFRAGMKPVVGQSHMAQDEQEKRGLEPWGLLPWILLLSLAGAVYTMAVFSY